MGKVYHNKECCKCHKITTVVESFGNLYCRDCKKPGKIKGHGGMLKGTKKHIFAKWLLRKKYQVRDTHVTTRHEGGGRFPASALDTGVPVKEARQGQGALFE